MNLVEREKPLHIIVQHMSGRPEVVPAGKLMMMATGSHHQLIEFPLHWLIASNQRHETADLTINWQSNFLLLHWSLRIKVSNCRDSNICSVKLFIKRKVHAVSCLSACAKMCAARLAHWGITTFPTHSNRSLKLASFSATNQVANGGFPPLSWRHMCASRIIVSFVLMSMSSDELCLI